MSWGDITPIFGTDVNHNILGGISTINGSGISDLALTVTLAQMASGNIGHALGVATEFTCDYSVPPATHNDGTATGLCIPEGARIQLDPSIDLATIPGITPFELAVGTALQQYGAFVKDTSGDPMAISFQDADDSGNGATWAQYGDPVDDYWTMPHIPWGALRVLAFPS